MKLWIVIQELLQGVTLNEQEKRVYKNAHQLRDFFQHTKESILEFVTYVRGNEVIKRHRQSSFDYKKKVPYNLVLLALAKVSVQKKALSDQELRLRQQFVMASLRKISQHMIQSLVYNHLAKQRIHQLLQYKLNEQRALDNNEEEEEEEFDESHYVTSTQGIKDIHQELKKDCPIMDAEDIVYEEAHPDTLDDVYSSNQWGSYVAQDRPTSYEALIEKRMTFLNSEKNYDFTGHYDEGSSTSQVRYAKKKKRPIVLPSLKTPFKPYSKKEELKQRGFTDDTLFFSELSEGSPENELMEDALTIKKQLRASLLNST
eukprot:CAMPEP_0117420490 /NCGR_PEP_ID=MMETSP0758-20121206/1813_1 /TAXON_ID=63605 /ORGANISM="Percolomonas cosmopolitus, Strain AE-1 (ATCC 50343)" /LENGTH=314 /DNA_ID=CAMNT_0005202129 /DNA_START=1600 /DNA_END=2544 /DNA_ORIENTATION=+